MPITSSAKKALRRDQRRQVVNYRVRAKVKKALDVIKRGSNSLEDLSNAQSILDTAVKKKVLHKNKVARLKSRLVKLVKSRGGSDVAATKPKKKVVKKTATKKTKTVKKVVAKKTPAKKKSVAKKAPAKKTSSTK